MKWDLRHCNQDGEGPSTIFEWEGWSQGSLAVIAHVQEASDLQRHGPEECFELHVVYKNY